MTERERTMKNRRAKRFYAKRVGAGRCRRCNRLTDENPRTGQPYTECATHRDWFSVIRKAWRAKRKGLCCWDCGAPAFGFARCPEHRQANVRNTQRYRQKQQVSPYAGFEAVTREILNSLGR